jgi:hypothetical protein
MSSAVRPARHADRLAQDVPYGRGLLAVGAELRPQLDDPRVVVENTALGEDVDHGRGHALADRVAKEGRVGGERASGRGVGDARGGVDHLFALVVDGDLQSPLSPGLNQLVDGFLDSLLNVGHDQSPCLLGLSVTLAPSRTKVRATSPQIPPPAS